MSDRLRGLTLGEAVRVERERLGYTLREVGSACGVGRSHICDIEHGRRMPSFEVCEDLASLLGIQDLAMRGFIVSPEVIEWACETPEVGRLLETLAHFNATPSQIDELMQAFIEIRGRMTT